MEKLAKNNLEAQLHLCNEIIDEYGKITFSVNTNAGEIESFIAEKFEKTDNSEVYQMSRNNYIELMSKLRYLKEDKLDNIYHYCKNSMENINRAKKLKQILTQK